MGATNAAKAAHEQVHAAAAAEDAAAAKAHAEVSAAINAAFEGVNMTGNEDYLKNVGSFVAAALDPLGIDVKIDIETPEGRKSCHVSNQSSEESKDDEKKDEASGDNEEAKKEEEKDKDGSLYPSLVDTTDTKSAPTTTEETAAA